MRWIYYLCFMFVINACASMKNTEKPLPMASDTGYFFRTKTGVKLFVYDYVPCNNYQRTVFVISGITGINQHAEIDLIHTLSNNKNRVVIVHPRGTGYSDGKRGDMANFNDFTNDYVELISNDKDYASTKHKVIVFGHSMSTAVLLQVATKLQQIGGAILVNPPYLLKKAKGMSPSIDQYAVYAWYMLFNKHKPIVNMAGNPALIENEADRKDSEIRNNDPLLVKYFSMYMMLASQKLLKAMPENAKEADFPLLLIYGEKDNIVDKKGCDLIFDSWKSKHKQYLLQPNGTHGKSSVLLSNNEIQRWIDSL